jgi:HEPN domain-containing protein
MPDEKRKETAAWLQKAADDVRTARVVMAAAPPLVEAALFHCQQAAEKSMKAFLTAHDTPFRKTHDLDELGMACEWLDASLGSVTGPARDLTVFAWEFRYPGSGTPPAEAETAAAISLAEAVLSAVQQRLAGMAQ